MPAQSYADKINNPELKVATEQYVSSLSAEECRELRVLRDNSRKDLAAWDAYMEMHKTCTKCLRLGVLCQFDRNNYLRCTVCAKGKKRCSRVADYEYRWISLAADMDIDQVKARLTYLSKKKKKNVATPSISRRRRHIVKHAAPSEVKVQEEDNEPVEDETDIDEDEEAAELESKVLHVLLCKAFDEEEEIERIQQEIAEKKAELQKVKEEALSIEDQLKSGPKRPRCVVLAGQAYRLEKWSADILATVTNVCRALSELDTAVARARATESPSAFLCSLYKEITEDFERDMHILTLTGALSALEGSEADEEDDMVI
ncbi:hypothetical protein CVT26_003351 [Gymnopilus dilepis]|uniref:Uncharacterized protein n=1 Tax=Gymnopilus dilepis TaxID=231916 RepID=A0A409VQJ1_9AGAR|nr:hypothetical protein CVT26_003351 [Gymnopilus dilepis]